MLIRRLVSNCFQLNPSGFYECSIAHILCFALISNHFSMWFSTFYVFLLLFTHTSFEITCKIYCWVIRAYCIKKNSFGVQKKRFLRKKLGKKMVHSYQSTNNFAERYLISVKGGKYVKRCVETHFIFQKIEIFLENGKKFLFASVKTWVSRLKQLFATKSIDKWIIAYRKKKT